MMKFSLALTMSAVSGTRLGGSSVEAMYEELQASNGDDFWLQRGDGNSDEWWWSTDMNEVYDLGEDIWYTDDTDQDDGCEGSELHTIGTKIIGQSESAPSLDVSDAEDDDSDWSLEDYEDDEDAADWGPLT